MSVPTLALSALAIAYIEARTLISEDATLIGRLLGRLVPCSLLERKHKVNTFNVLEGVANSHPNDIALRYPRQVKPTPKDITGVNLDYLFAMEEYTYKQVYDKVLQYAAVLRNEYGVNSSSTVGIDCLNSPDFIFVWWALWSLGALPAFINYNLTEKSLIHSISVATLDLLIVDSDLTVMNHVKPCEEDIKAHGTSVVYMDASFHSLVENATPYRAPDSERHPEHTFADAGMLIYTSGTTGLPKPAIVSWRKCSLGSSIYAAPMRMDSSSVIFSAMPLYHSSASVLSLLTAWNSRATFVVGRKFSPSTFWTQAKLSKASHVQYIGETCRYLLKAPPNVDDQTHGVRVAYGNGMRPDIWMRFKKRFNIPVIGEFYAATEGPSALTNYQEGEIGVGAVGKYGTFASSILFNFAHTIVKIDPLNESELYRDPKTGLCVPAGVNEPGEMMTKIPADQIKTAFQGYYGNKKASDEKVIRNIYKQGDAYFRSGDLLRWDENNFVYFVDRLGDTFRWKSENVSTNEVEEVISDFENHSLVHQVVVVGVEIPQHDGRAGFAVIAPHDVNKLPDPQALATYLTAQLPKYAIPVFIKFVNSISNTGNNKIQKAVYRQQKFPNLEEKIWWFNGTTYLPLGPNDWSLISAGKVKL